ncbi:5947_t:CDS:2 [Acaulospora morrowiae]|uniref:5947_t:CDS:1 n=1 Tax=Acaulospora morrowiae TaxID=94023 RepID=A0A9N8WIB9_9GLOM|nr:5947_t:CDS:2 [Acaulospora morrowiae]
MLIELMLLVFLECLSKKILKIDIKEPSIEKIRTYTIFDEDWSFANGRSTDCLSNASNANTGNPVAIPGIQLEQVLYWFKTNYSTVTAKKQQILFGSTVQGNNPIEVCHLGIEKSPDELLLKLEEIERYTAEQLFEAYLHSNSDSEASKDHGKNNYSNNTDMTKEEIENLIKDIMASSLS